jgi:hypothetical protein
MQSDLIKADFVEECKAIVTEAVFNSRWSLVEGYWNLGKRVREEFGEKTYGQKIAQGLAESIGVSERTINYAVEAYDKYPQLDTLPEGKNISWNKLITKYLTVKTEAPTANVMVVDNKVICPVCGYKFDINQKEMKAIERG